MEFTKTFMIVGLLCMHISYGQIHEIARPLSPVICVLNQDKTITIKEAQDHDFQEIKDLGVKTFAAMYNFTTPEQINGLEKTYNSIIAEEAEWFANDYKNAIVLIATYDDKIVGYFSANATDKVDELYGRFLVVDPLFQHQGVGIKLLQYCRKFLPGLKRIVCMTNKKNKNAQSLYEYFGGKVCENLTCSKYLYKILNAADYIGYEFDESAIVAFDRREEKV